MTVATLVDQGAPWVQTASGRAVSFAGGAQPISIRDIAAHLAKICRFAGATSTFYSVAQHSVLVSQLCADFGPQGQLYGLLHDAHEAYIGDIPRPMKQAISRMLGHDTLSPIDEIANRLDRAIMTHVGLDWPIPAAIRDGIHHADLRALATEKRDLLPDEPDWTAGLPPPWRASLKPWPWPKAEERFLTLFNDLSAMCGLTGCVAE